MSKVNYTGGQILTDATPGMKKKHFALNGRRSTAAIPLPSCAGKGKAGCCAVSPVIPERTASWKRCGRFAIAEWDPNREKAEAADQPSVASAFSIDSGRFKAETLSSA